MGQDMHEWCRQEGHRRDGARAAVQKIVMMLLREADATAFGVNDEMGVGLASEALIRAARDIGNGDWEKEVGAEPVSFTEYRVQAQIAGQRVVITDNFGQPRSFRVEAEALKLCLEFADHNPSIFTVRVVK